MQSTDGGYIAITLGPANQASNVLPDCTVPSSQGQQQGEIAIDAGGSNPSSCGTSLSPSCSHSGTGNSCERFCCCKDSSSRSLTHTANTLSSSIGSCGQGSWVSMQVGPAAAGAMLLFGRIGAEGVVLGSNPYVDVRAVATSRAAGHSPYVSVKCIVP